MTSQSKYDMRLNPVYQVDWQNAASGKRVSATKRRVRWRFGFSNAEAITQGCTGTECRGEEHEVSLVWSLTSGKRLVVADGEEVHFSFGKRTDTKFETSWTMRSGGHLIKLICYAAPPLFYTPGFRQFDLLLDGCSFFDMPKIFQLGMPNKKALARVAAQPQAYNNYTLDSPPREQAPRQEEPREQAPRQEVVEDIVSAPVTVPDLMDDGPTVTQEVQQPDEFTPQPPPPPTFDSVSNQILSAYDPMPQATVPVLANEPHTYGTPLQAQPQQGYEYQQPQQEQYQPQPQYQYQQDQYQQQYQQDQYQQPQQQQYQQDQYQPQQQQQQQQTWYTQQPAPVPVSPDSSTHSMDASPEVIETPTVFTPTMEPVNLRELEERDAQMSDFDKAIHSLVNLDCIDETIETPEQAKSKEQKKRKEPVKSKPLPPTQPEWHLGPKAKLQDIKEHAPAKETPAREIMRTHAFDPRAAQAGMMVVYGATMPQQPQQQGFGYAAQQEQYYAQQQQYYAQQQQQYAQQQQQPMYAAY